MLSDEFQPIVTNMHLCALFGHFYRERIKIKLSKHFKFQGGLHGVVQNHYCDVHSVRQNDYGNFPNIPLYDLEGKHKIRNRVYNETLDLNDLKTLYMVCSKALSTYCALQGG